MSEAWCNNLRACNLASSSGFRCTTYTAIVHRHRTTDCSRRHLEVNIAVGSLRFDFGGKKEKDSSTRGSILRSLSPKSSWADESCKHSMSDSRKRILSSILPSSRKHLATEKAAE